MTTSPAFSAQTLPRHIGIIMDGNGRWAEDRHLPRTAGHKQGAETVKKIVEEAKKLGIAYLTLFAFSLENWSRPHDEVNDLMGLLRRYLKSDAADFHKQGARLKVIGDRSRLDDDIVQSIDSLETLTRDNQNITIQIAISYGGRDEIFKASQRFAEFCLSNGLKPSEATQAQFEACLMTAGIPDPDLIIRTSGEMRISNFLLWQSAYAEYVFSPVYWPEFSVQSFHDALSDFVQRKRRFGSVSGSVSVSSSQGSV